MAILDNRDLVPADHSPGSVLAGIAQECHETSVAHGFWDRGPPGVVSILEVGRNFGEALALIHSELSEALDEYRGECTRGKILEELADVIIRALDLGTGLTSPQEMAGAVLNKMQTNCSRPYKHGKAL